MKASTPAFISVTVMAVRAAAKTHDLRLGVNAGDCILASTIVIGIRYHWPPAISF